MNTIGTTAQTNTTKIKDGTVAGSSVTPVLGAVLELESTTKGFLTPRMTISQRDAIPMAQRLEGLILYNTTTGCLNYWSQEQKVWLSICGTPPPAVIKINTTQCRTVAVNGIFKQGEFLNTSNSLNIPITVTQAGTYDITASSSNGYYFSKKGTFPSTGTYMLNLEGVGTPRSGYANGEAGDEIDIIVNGIPNMCKPFVFVENANVDFMISCASIKASGDYFMGQRLDDSHKLNVQVNVISTGFWSIETNILNGYSFSGTGVFEQTGPQLIELTANGKPVQSGVNLFNLSTNAQTTTNCSNIPVEVANVKYTADCSLAVVQGDFMQDVAVNTNNAIKLTVDVQATGQTVIQTNTVSGISFTSGPINLDRLGTQDIVLKASGTPTVNGTLDFELTGTPGLIDSCTIKVLVNAQPISYTMSCSSIEMKGLYSPEISMNNENTMVIEVRVLYPGDYSISTNAVNGISFSGSGVFSTRGSQKVILKATGTPVSGGSFNYTITSNSTAGGTSCTKSVEFLYRTMKVLGMGSGIYQPATASSNNTSKGILQSKANFGPNGTIKVQDIVIINGGTSQGNSIKELINNHNIDIIVIGYDYRPNRATNDILLDFIRNKKGVLIQGQENDNGGIEDLINRISNSTVTKISGWGASAYNPHTGITDPILEGPFGNLVGKGGGGDLNNSYYVTTYPRNMKNLMSQAGEPTKAWLLKHESLGYVFIGDAGWLAGDSSNSSTGIWPAAISATGLPVGKPYAGDTVVYNSVIYANIMAWAIKYIQENTVSDYKIN
ncbi:hypothetical protein [Flavobacterium sp. NKUCC04_CG]|uniref:hypothetical protein n=1 Tax=Flavobacterium sp. NKUCC04_CG TaxID=2842121 RepID=UPI00210853E5|nr:hypothetical protein [Flavobacterium sp. NKUCC04_CG]